MNTVNKRKVAPAARARGRRGAATARAPPPASVSLSIPSVSVGSSSGTSKSSASSSVPSASLAPAARRTRTCHLLRIPPELRLKIFGYAVVDPLLIEPKVVDTLLRIRRLDGGNRKNEFKEVEESEESEAEEPKETKRSFMSSRRERNGLALARTCSFIRNEVLPVYFGGNTFRFPTTKDLYFYLSSMSPCVRSMIKKIIFTWTGQQVYSGHAFRVLKYLPSLEELTIVVWYDISKGLYGPPSMMKDPWKADGVEILRTLRVANPSRFKLSVANAKHPRDLRLAYKRTLEIDTTHELAGRTLFVLKECYDNGSLENFNKELSAEIKQEAVSSQGFMLATGGPFGKSRQSERMIEKERKGVDGRQMATRRY